jgi:pyridoxamine 5'-phosphate oxidase
MLNLQDMRQDYKKAELSEESVNESPFVQFEQWFGDAQKSQVLEPTLWFWQHAGVMGYPIFAPFF